MNATFSDLDSIIQLSKDNDTLGFDLSTGQTWIYPTNYQVRDYQFNITQAALHNNTLVSLPTGLGKTFIAAVIMYNFYRWYPMGKIIFMAPTRPLVKQQQDACYNIMAIPPDATAEMTGNKVKASRVKIWKEKRVFFITPQILQNDIDVVLDLAQQIKCIVIDEAHKALGKHANCEAIKKIHKINKYFRVLALSATPGSNFNSVRDVITNLLISHIEARTNESIDVAPFVFKRKLETFVIPITGELLAVKNKYILILDKYTRPLLQFNIFSGNCANLTKGRIVLVMKEFKEKGRQHPKYGFILKSLNLCVTLYHGYELLIRHGLRGFLVFFDGTISKPLINSIQELHGILNDVRNYLGPLEEIEMLPDGTVPEVEGPVVYSHPKFIKLNEVLVEHFKKIEDDDTRVMVFCEYRESVMQIYQMLLRQRPLIKPRVFLGQGAISQAKQMQAVKQFKSGACNALISTCIGEEGLDVGEVDLIVCFDISSKSPIRMVQRMGRTGRKRDGRVVVLVTEGKEQQLLSESMVQKNNMISILEAQPIKHYLYNDNPKMIPDCIKPQCNKMFITVKESEKPMKKEDSKKKTKVSKNSNTLKSMFDNISSQSSKKSEEDSTLRTRKTHKSPVKATRGSKKLPTSSSNQMDLRSMFSKINNTQCTTDSSQVCTQESSDSKIEECAELNTLVTKIRSFLNTSIINKSSCKICYILNNTNVCSTTSSEITTKWTKPDLSILNSITSKSLANFSASIATGKNTTFNNYTNFNPCEDSSTIGFNNLTAKSSKKDNLLKFFNLESIYDIFSDDSSESQEDQSKDVIIFNKSLEIFQSSCIYQTPVKTSIYETEELNKTKITENNEQNVFESENIKTDTNENNDSESLSPILCSRRNVDYKQKIQRKLFSSNDQQTNSNKIQTIDEFSDKQDVLAQCKKNFDVSTPKYGSNITEMCKINYNFTDVNTTPNQSSCLATEKTCMIKNTMSTPIINSNNDYNTDFWDESLFEVCDSDESLFENENKLDANKQTLSKCTDKQTEIIDKKINNSNENKENSDSDSDATIILSFNNDQIFEDIEQEALKSPIIEQFTKPANSDNNISVCNNTNKTNSSLLSITQAIDLLNDSKFKSFDNSMKISENINSGTSTQCLRNPTFKNNLLKIPVAEENKKLLINSITKTITVSLNSNEIDTNIDYNTNITEINKESNDKNNESEEEFSLLSFSQQIRKRKLQQNQKKFESENTAKFARTSIDERIPENTQTNITSNNNTENILKSNCDKTILDNKKTKNSCQILNDLKDENSDNDFQDEHNNIFTQKMKKLRNKKFKLSTLKNTNNKLDKTINKMKNANTKSDETMDKLFTQISPVQLAPKNEVIILSDSDDDFDVRPTIKPIPVKKLERVNSLPSYSKTNENTHRNAKTANVPKSRSQSYPTRNKNIGSKKKSACAFIDDEAEVEDDENYESDSDSERNSDELDSSFVSYTQILDQTDMRTKYLQSIRSPKFKPGTFKMPHRSPAKVYDNVYSQIENYEDDTYIADTFCVDNDQPLTEREDMSILEELEAHLEKENKEKRNKKRKRIITLSDSD